MTFSPRNGADALVAASVRAGVDVCFANPGTTEMSMVSALSAVPGIRSVLVLFEGVASGAADGYARIAGKPSATLLHLGPGLGNATANLHNARRAEAPVVNWVGDHATWLLPHDPPLASDIASIARGTSAWVRTTHNVLDIGRDAVEAVRAAAGPPGAVATLIIPDDVQKLPLPEGFSLPALTPSGPPRLDAAHIAAVAEKLRAARAPLVLLGGSTLDERGLRAAARIAHAGKAQLLGEQFPRNLRRASGLIELNLLNYIPAMARPQLMKHDLILLAGADHPVCFFGYTGEAPLLTSDKNEVVTLAPKTADVYAALEALADALGAPQHVPVADRPAAPAQPTGALTRDTLATAVAALLPDNAIIVNEGITSSLALYASLKRAAPHDYLSCKGGSIGWGTPAATGAALAAPGRRVVTLVGDGSAAYTIQSLWTQAREQLDVTTIVAVNAKYAILQMELMRSGGKVEGAGKLLTVLDSPLMSFTALAEGFGVPARKASTCETFVQALRDSFATPGPMLIEAIIP